MKLLCTISLTRCYRLLLIGLLVFGLGCSDDDLLSAGSGEQPPATYSANALIDYVLPPASGVSPTQAFLPQRARSLWQTAPSDENDRAYWQWYFQTLTMPGTTTEYRRNADGSIFLLWNFNDADGQRNVGIRSGQLTLYVREQDQRLTVAIRVEEFDTGQHILTGYYQSVWELRASSIDDRPYRLLTEINNIIAKDK